MNVRYRGVASAAGLLPALSGTTWAQTVWRAGIGFKHEAARLLKVIFARRLRLDPVSVQDNVLPRSLEKITRAGDTVDAAPMPAGQPT